MDWPSSETTFTRTFLEIFSGDSNSEQIFRFYVSHQQRWNELRLAIESPGTRAFNSAKLQPPMSLLPSFLRLPSYQKASSTLTHKIILGSKRVVTEPRKLKPLLHFSWTISCKKIGDVWKKNCICAARCKIFAEKQLGRCPTVVQQTLASILRPAYKLVFTNL